MQRQNFDGFSLFNGASLSSPVLVSVPHAGRDYPQIIFDSLRLPRASLLRLEDRFADLLARSVAESGNAVIVAERARAWIDLNRDDSDLDVEMAIGAAQDRYASPSAKQRGGLGLIPRRLSGEGDLWKRQFDLAEIEQRIAAFHRPFHAEVANTLKQIHAKFGVALLLDLHSMPPIRNFQHGAAPQFVIGDRFGKSADSKYAELLTQQIRLHGFHAALNHPYAGDYILRRHARRGANVHAIQLEVDRSLYLDAALREPGPGLSRITQLIATLTQALADEAIGRATLIAAE